MKKVIRIINIVGMWLFPVLGGVNIYFAVVGNDKPEFQVVSALVAVLCFTTGLECFVDFKRGT